MNAAELQRLENLGKLAEHPEWECGENPTGFSSNEIVVRPRGEFPHGDWIADFGNGEEGLINARLATELRNNLGQFVVTVRADSEWIARQPCEQPASSMHDEDPAIHDRECLPCQKRKEGFGK